MCDVTRNQWKFMRVGVMCSQSLVHVRSLAAEFLDILEPVQDLTAIIRPVGEKVMDEGLCYRCSSGDISFIWAWNGSVKLKLSPRLWTSGDSRMWRPTMPVSRSSIFGSTALKATTISSVLLLLSLTQVDDICVIIAADMTKLSLLTSSSTAEAQKMWTPCAILKSNIFFLCWQGALF